MCIRDRYLSVWAITSNNEKIFSGTDEGVYLSTNNGSNWTACLLYTSDAADERSSVDLGGRRIIKKKTIITSVAEGGVKTEKRKTSVKTIIRIYI